MACHCFTYPSTWTPLRAKTYNLPSMDFFSAQKLTAKTLEVLNQFRIYWNIIMLSDIVPILEQGVPKQQNWEIRWSCLLELDGQDKLLAPLSTWEKTPQQIWIQCVDLTDKHLHITMAKGVRCFPQWFAASTTRSSHHRNRSLLQAVISLNPLLIKRN